MQIEGAWRRAGSMFRTTSMPTTRRWRGCSEAEISRESATELILSPTTRVWVSVASVWEIAIKHKLGRGDMPVSSQDAVRYFGESGYRLLAIEAEHVVTVEALPTHH